MNISMGMTLTWQLIFASEHEDCSLIRLAKMVTYTVPYTIQCHVYRYHHPFADLGRAAADAAGVAAWLGRLKEWRARVRTNIDYNGSIYEARYLPRASL